MFKNFAVKKKTLMIILLLILSFSVMATPIFSGSVDVVTSLIEKFHENEMLRVITNSSYVVEQAEKSGCQKFKVFDGNTVLVCTKSTATELIKTGNARMEKRYKISLYTTDDFEFPDRYETKDQLDNIFIGADQVWDLGYTGKDSLVAVLDTGIDYNHPELADSYFAGYNFAEYCYSESGEHDFDWLPLGCAFLWYSKDECLSSPLDCVWKEEGPDAMDDNSHGTHVSGIITANGVGGDGWCYNTSSGPFDFPGDCTGTTLETCRSIAAECEWTYRSKGIAPDAKIMMGKVCSKWGWCWESDIIEGLNWAANGVSKIVEKDCYEKCGQSSSCCRRYESCTYENRRCEGTFNDTVTYKPDVISMSLSGGSWINSYCDKEEVTKVANKIARNIPVVASAGNFPYGVGAPACGSMTIAAGASLYNWIASFSGRGYAMEKTGVVAPGVLVYSTIPNNKYATFSGTSMAAPNVAGLIALIKDKYQLARPPYVKNAVFNGAFDLTEDEFCQLFGLSLCGFIAEDYGYEQGHGRIDALTTINNIRRASHNRILPN